jgi:uncharacterized phage protein gp47/JayE
MGIKIPTLSDKTFDEIFTEARALISRYSPTWTDQNFHDPGITFIDLFAWLAEVQMYYLDRVTEDHKRKFLEMVGFSPLGLQPAQVSVSFSPVTAEKTIPAATQVLAKIGTEEIPFETEEEIFLVSANLRAVKSVVGSLVIDHTEANAQGKISFAAFGSEPPTGAALRLGFDKPLPAEDITMTILLFEGDLPPVGSHGAETEKITPSVEVVWEYLVGGSWQPLLVKDDGTLALTRSGRIIVASPLSMDKVDGLFWIQCRLSKGSYEIAPVIEKVLLNTVTLVQIHRVVEEQPVGGDGSPGYKVVLREQPVIEGSQNVQIRRNGGVWEEWQEVDDFDRSDPEDHHYLFDAAAGEITFGNGLNGRTPEPQDEIKASYQTTLGAKGNIPGGQRFELATDTGKIQGTNLKEAAGGKDAESIESVQARVLKDLRTRYRAITASDFEEVALKTPGLRVARAKAIPNFNPHYPCIANFPNAVTVVVVPVTRADGPTPLPGQGFLDTVTRHLDGHRLVTTDVLVVGPTYVKISVACTLIITKRSSANAVTDLVKQALAGFFDPLKGGLAGKGWPFGRSAFPGEIYQILHEVEGVDYVTGLSISAEGDYQEDGGTIKIPPSGLFYSGDHQIIIPE